MRRIRYREGLGSAGRLRMRIALCTTLAGKWRSDAFVRELPMGRGRALNEIVVVPAADNLKASQFARDCLGLFHLETVGTIRSEIPCLRRREEAHRWIRRAQMPPANYKEVLKAGNRPGHEFRVVVGNLQNVRHCLLAAPHGGGENARAY